VLRIDEDIGRSVSSRGLIHADGKKELAFDENRQIMVIDVYGTADEDRFWDKARYEAGELVEPLQGICPPALSPERLQRPALCGSRCRPAGAGNSSPAPEVVAETAASTSGCLR